MSTAHPEQLPIAEQAWMDNVEVPTDLGFAGADEVEDVLPDVLAELTPIFDEAGL